MTESHRTGDHLPRAVSRRFNSPPSDPTNRQSPESPQIEEMKFLVGLPPEKAIDTLLAQLRRAKTNAELLAAVS